ncbi:MULTISPECIES: heavy-metal-associated domain-containing protein [Atopobiaceae]|uniref:Copper chaperone CopZ n=1 Tax=Parafannyhessea umbonata TaxID=604330 RepID=A0A1H6K2K3_9ACTN|nr:MULTISPECIES: cation transporter [Atopobiaceae]SEH66551.1 Copper chaperone CopZ [Parafannyhessea umbonata]SJZ86060.1 Copper chaperone CopZ [Olsenella sp. KH1P3]
MGIADVVVLALVALAVALGARRFWGAATGKRDCCSGAKSDPGVSFARARVADADESHYPFSADLRIGGMSCARCAQRVESALNAVPGTWARVDLSQRCARVLCKKPIDLAAYEDVVAKAGYRVIKKC